MQFTINRERFVQSVQDVSKAISPRTTIPILTGIKIDAAEDGVTLTGSDSDISIESFIPVEENGEQIVTVETEGTIVLQARFFADIIKKLPENTLELSVTDQFTAQVKSGSSVFNINGLDPDEYPRLPEIDESSVFKMPKNLLKSMIRQTAFAVSTVETRPILTGIHWALSGEKLTCTATDSHRLAMRHAEVKSNDADLSFSNVVIPGKSLSELSKIIDDSDELIDIIVAENQILFKATNLLFFSRLLDGNYPATDNMIPTSGKTNITLETKHLLDAIERALLLSREGKNNVVHVKSLEDGKIEITSVTPEVGKVTEHVATNSYDGEALQISFNGKNMIDALKIVESSEITVDFTGAMSPFVLKPAEMDHMLHLFSPVRTY
ncbi:DNA polymerase III subunit beta [Salisediminibacterium halotolerans]|uniref:DNA polymerase III subunit beta n=1 Tax=Salisediminibacterium halotolerans TaxID=517425 RepID=UPI000EAC7D34|nr:DNA polymerase III subunit beta [Salisediminibacterium halotolerans]RLJ69739.1 DNA polymerase III beta subunit [Actinophytocola xinjiangensis]RPE89797.1 DNA polymerase III beta subunit [Salisediminibacterium halotolerans]TWG32633.1 DNA polymerase III beta subunit [Salisediminibacterium halotolerans]GEL07555.1 DNA polymerase III subunit beta [Salisediminibacterium halotolerans]